MIGRTVCPSAGDLPQASRRWLLSVGASAAPIMSAPCPTFGFVVAARLRNAGAGSDTLVGSLSQLLEANGLEMSRSDRSLEYIVSREGTQATQADRELVLSWADRWSELADIEVTDLMDLGECRS